MKIVNIFVHVDKSLLAVQYDNEDCDELTRLINRWTDPEELRDFFKANQKFITDGFFGTISVNDAVE